MSLPSTSRSLLTLVVVAAVGLAASGTSLASGPLISENDDTTPQSIIEWGDCPGFMIDATYMANRRNEDFYDAQGNLVLERRHIQYTGTLYNAADPGHTLSYSGAFILTFDFVANTVRNSGLVDHVIVPGKGMINLTAGLFLAGPDWSVEHGPSGDVTQLCAALS